MGYVQTISSQIGTLQVSASELGLTSVSLIDKPAKDDLPNEYTQSAVSELESYFKGNLTSFTTVLDWTGYTDFYKSVWRYLIEVPFGQTRSYLDIAKHLDNPGASRAVGLANGKNPIPIIVPCHRIIGSNGSLTGFALGLDIKRQLLMLENPNSFAMQQKLF